MRKPIALLLLVLGVWTGAEVYEYGIDGAFGGLFVKGLRDASAVFDAPANHRATPRRTADAFQRAYDKSEQRVERLLDPPSQEDEPLAQY